MGDLIRPVKNEIMIKQYDIAVLRNPFNFERTEGRMQVTNKRVIFVPPDDPSEIELPCSMNSPLLRSQVLRRKKI